MLVLSRRTGESIRIGTDITVRVVQVVGNRVKLGIEAPDDKRILRSELAFWVEEDKSADQSACDIMAK